MHKLNYDVAFQGNLQSKRMLKASQPKERKAITSTTTIPTVNRSRDQLSTAKGGIIWIRSPDLKSSSSIRDTM
jgi:hypothetical protein